MISNKDIRKKEIYKVNQRLIKVYGDLKKAQSDLILALNDCAVAECCHYNALKKGVIMQNFKHQLRHYFKVYGDKIIYEEQRDALTKWRVEDESTTNH